MIRWDPQSKTYIHYTRGLPGATPSENIPDNEFITLAILNELSTHNELMADIRNVLAELVSKVAK